MVVTDACTMYFRLFSNVPDILSTVCMPWACSMMSDTLQCSNRVCHNQQPPHVGGHMLHIHA